MKIRVGTLRKIIREFLLLEYTVSGNVTLYHRSPKKFEVGDVLTAQVDPATGQHWQAAKRHEQELERYRQKKHPDLPSRFECIFASFHPRSRFIGKGNLYAIKPIGRTFVTDSKILDAIADQATREGGGYYSNLIEEYWEGVEPGRGNLASAEILMDSAEVLEVMSEPKRMQIGTRISFGPGSPTLRGKINISGSKSPQPKVAASNGNTYRPVEEALEELKNTAGLSVGKAKEDEWSSKIELTIGPGFEGFVTSYRVADPGASYSMKPRVAISPGDGRSPTGVWIDLEEPEKFIKAFRMGAIKRRGD